MTLPEAATRDRFGREIFRVPGSPYYVARCKVAGVRIYRDGSDDPVSIGFRSIEDALREIARREQEVTHGRR